VAIGGRDIRRRHLAGEEIMVNWLAILVAAIAKFAIGAVWYAPLFGRQWRELQGIPEGSPPDGMVQAMVVQIVTDLVMAYILVRFIIYYGSADLLSGAFVGVMAWFGFVITIMVGAIFYERRPPMLVAINGGYQLLGLAVMGAILGAWH
jgi:ABC-type antimicrobial peptide transport system permease subunit